MLADFRFDVTLQFILHDLEEAIDIFGAKQSRDLARLSQNVESFLNLGLESRLEAAWPSEWSEGSQKAPAGLCRIRPKL